MDTKRLLWTEWRSIALMNLRVAGCLNCSSRLTNSCARIRAFSRHGSIPVTVRTLHLNGSVVNYADRPALTRKVREHAQRRSKHSPTPRCGRACKGFRERSPDLIGVVLVSEKAASESGGVLTKHDPRVVVF